MADTPEPVAGELDLPADPALLEAVIERWRATFDSIPDPIVLVDAALRVRRANAAAAGDRAIPAVLGEPCHRLLFDRIEPCGGCPALALGPGETGDGDVELAEVGRIWSVHVAPLQPRGDERGAEAWRVCQHRDVTEARRLQREVLMLEKLAALGELAGNLAHELNNPLTAILTFAQLLGRGRVAPEMQSELIGDIEREAQRCSRLIQSLLRFGRSSGGDGSAGALNLGALVQECLRVFEAQLSGKPVVFEVEGLDDPGLPPVTGVADALRSLVINLVQNAVLSMDKQGTVQISLAAVEGSLRLQVGDTGPGVPELLRHRIFEPFYSTRPPGRGTGLGLSIVHKVVRDHGGRITVGASASGGALFEVHLPAARPAMNVGHP